MKKIFFDKEFFNVKDTLECGQVFRFRRHNEGYAVFTGDKCCFLYEDGDFSVIVCEDDEEDYFKCYFDLSRDYSSIVKRAENYGTAILNEAAKVGKGIRILNQNAEEALFSFVISQNNNIPRIKSIIEKLCVRFGVAKSFMGNDYYAFPSAAALNAATAADLQAAGLGYRAEYVKRLAEEITDGFNLSALEALTTDKLRERLLRIKGVGPKVADCAVLFGFHRSDSFPVDTWIEKTYREDFGGSEKDRKKVSAAFIKEFGEDAGYFQQYLFHYKRNFTG